jgi:hypothetical protein
MAADERRQGKVNGKGKFYHPFAALSRATEDTEEKREKTLKAGS